MSVHFLLRRRLWFWDGQTWSMIRAGKEVKSRTDYILGIDCHLFWNVSVRYPRHNSDHYMVLGCLRSASLRGHSRYLGGQKRLPLRPPTTPTRKGVLFATLRRAVLKPQAQDARKNAWISEATWTIVDERVSARRDPAKDQSLIWRLCCAIAEILKGDRRRWAEEAEAEVEALLGSYPPLHGEAWYRINWWYRTAVDRAPTPVRVTLEPITVNQVELYSYVLPPGANIPIYVEPFPVYNLVPTEDEIEGAVKCLRNHRSRGASGMRDEHLKKWLAA